MTFNAAFVTVIAALAVIDSALVLQAFTRTTAANEEATDCVPSVVTVTV